MFFGESEKILLQHSASVIPFAIALVLMLGNWAINLLPAIRSGLPQARAKALIRVLIINTIILAIAMVYVISHR